MTKDIDKKARTKGGIGSSFEQFLIEEELLEECDARAIKDIIALQVELAMKSEHITKTEMARRMKTSRPALDRLLDKKNTSVTLHTLQRAAAAVGKRLHLEITDAVRG